MSVILQNGVYEISPISPPEEAKLFFNARKWHLIGGGTVGLVAIAVCMLVLPHPFGLVAWGVVVIAGLIAVAYTFYRWRQEHEDAIVAAVQAHPPQPAEPPAPAQPDAQPPTGAGAATPPSGRRRRVRASPSTQPQGVPGLARRASHWVWQNKGKLAAAATVAAAGYVAYSTGAIDAAAAGMSQAAGNLGTVINTLLPEIRPEGFEDGAAPIAVAPATDGSWSSPLVSLFSTAAMLANGARLFRQERHESP